MVTLVIAVSYVLLGSLFIGVAVPLIQGRIKPNPWYGVRVPKTLRDPETWYAVNAYFGRRFAVAGLLLAVVAVGLSPLGLIPRVGALTYSMLCQAIMLGSLIWITIDTFRYLRKF
jgi:uncharacterized sodium:solute symporter family permease YidK